MTTLKGLLALIGRVVLTAIFVAGAYGAITGWEGHVGAIEGTDLPMPMLMAVGSVALLVLGSLSLILGLFTRWGALLLMIFLAVVTPVMHAFWDDPAQQPAFFKNVSLFGALLLVLAFGPGSWSLDRWRERRRTKQMTSTEPTERTERPI